MKILTALSALLCTLFAPAIVFASAAKGEHHVPSVADLFWPAINFTIYLVIVLIACKKLIPKALLARADQIRKGVETGRVALKSAEKELATARTLITTFEEQAEAISLGIQKDSENEALLIKSNSETRGKAIVAQARAAAAAEQRSTETILREELAEMIVKLAEEKIRQELTPENDRVLRERAVQGVSVLKG